MSCARFQNGTQKENPVPGHLISSLWKAEDEGDEDEDEDR
jgi:hypothetical protein